MLQDFRCIAAHWPFARIDSSQYPDIESFAISSPQPRRISGCPERQLECVRIQHYDGCNAAPGA